MKRLSVVKDSEIWIDADMAEVAIQIESENQTSKRCSSISEMPSDILQISAGRSTFWECQMCSFRDMYAKPLQHGR